MEVDIVYFGDQWDRRWRRRQQFAHRLAQLPQVRRLIYVELPLSLTSLIRLAVGQADHDASYRWRRAFTKGFSFRDDKVRIITPISPLPPFRQIGISGVGSWAWRKITQARIDRSLRETGAFQRLLWISHPFAFPFVESMEHSHLCYDCTEVFHRFQELQNVSSLIRKLDQQLTSQADLVLTQTKSHWEEKKRLNPHTFLLPNAVGLPQGKDSSANKGDPLQEIPRPIIGYVGNLNYRIDLGLLFELAQGNRGWSFVFIGPKDKGLALGALARLRNVHLVPEKPYELLPNYIAQFSVGLMPYSLHPLEQSPTKLFDYLAQGIPVVSTPIPGALDFRKALYVARDAQEFKEAIRLAMAEESPERRQQRLALAHANSWDARFQELQQILADVGIL